MQSLEIHETSGLKAEAENKTTSPLLAILVMMAELSQVCFSLFAAADFTQRWKCLSHQGLKKLSNSAALFTHMGLYSLHPRGRRDAIRTVNTCHT